MRYSLRVRLIGIAMGLTLLISTGYLVFLMILGYGVGVALNAEQNEFPVYELVAYTSLGFLGGLILFVSVLKRKKSTPVIFGISAVVIFGLSLNVNEATRAFTLEIALLAFSLASFYLAFRTWNENKSGSS